MTPPTGSDEFKPSVCDVSEDDALAVIGILRDVDSVIDGPDARRRKLMESLARLIHADAWAWSLLQFEADQAPRQLLLLHGGFSDHQLAKWTEAVEHPTIKRVTEKLVSEAMAGTTGFTRRDDEFVPSDWWDNPNDPSFALWTQAGLRSMILSAWPVTGHGFSGVGIYRTTDKPTFTQRDAALAHLLLGAIGELHTNVSHLSEGGLMMRLPSSQRTLLHLLSAGWDIGLIAKEQEKSPQQIQRDIDDLQAALGSSADASLIDLFHRRTGREPFAPSSHEP